MVENVDSKRPKRERPSKRANFPTCRLCFAQRMFLVAFVLAVALGPLPYNVVAEPESVETNTLPLGKSLDSPQATLRTLITSVNEGHGAVECFDLSNLNPILAHQRGPRLAKRLKEIIDRVRRINYDDIPADPKTSSPYRLGREYLALNWSGRDARDLEAITLERGTDGLWRFSSNTVNSIEKLWDRWQDRDKVKGLTVNQAKVPFEDWLRKQFPERLRHVKFLLPTYKWIYFLGLVFVGFSVDLLVRCLLNYLTAAWSRYRKSETDKKTERNLWKPIGLLAQALVWYGGTSLIDLPDLTMTILLAGLKIFSVVAGVWTGFLLINLMAAYLTTKAAQTETKFDDLLVPLVSKSLKIFIVFIGVLTCAQAFSLPMAGLLGGTAIGGMALALAAQDSVSNLFGSITVLIDRPFEIGDWIVTGNVEGTVETVGFRSTRIRTFYNSQITVPNSNLTTAIVDNMGRRRFRRIKTVFGLQYDTTPDQIDAFCEGTRELLRRHPYTRKDYFHVYFNDFGDNSLNVLLYCFLECPDWAIELREKHRLFLDILQLAKRLGISFAFPTRTVHFFQEDASSDGTSTGLSDPLRTGQQLAAELAGPLQAPTQRPGPVSFSGPTDVSG